MMREFDDLPPAESEEFLQLFLARAARNRERYGPDPGRERHLWARRLGEQLQQNLREIGRELSQECCENILACVAHRLMHQETPGGPVRIAGVEFDPREIRMLMEVLMRELAREDAHAE